MTRVIALCAALMLAACATLDEITALGAYLSWVKDQQRERDERR